MNTSRTDSNGNPLFATLQNLKLRPGLAFGIIILTALLAFEIFNYSTTDYALRDLLGDLAFAGLRWSTILSIAFCGIDFAGIARLFTPEQGRDEPKEVWYLFGAWLLAATMNATLTWWGVSMAVTNHSVLSTQNVVDQSTMVKVVPVFVAIMVWVIRILIIGSFSYAGDRFFNQESKVVKSSSYVPSRRPASVPSEMPAMTMAPRPVPNRSASNQRPVVQPRPTVLPPEPPGRPEPTYHSLSARPAGRPASSVSENPDYRRH